MCEDISVGCWQRRNLGSRRCKHRRQVRQRGNSQHPPGTWSEMLRKRPWKLDLKRNPLRLRASHWTHINSLCGVCLVFFSSHRFNTKLGRHLNSHQEKLHGKKRTESVDLCGPTWWPSLVVTRPSAVKWRLLCGTLNDKGVKWQMRE